MGKLGTALDTKLEKTAPHSYDGSFIYRGFQPFVRPRAAPEKDFLYAVETMKKYFKPHVKEEDGAAIAKQSVR